MLIGSWIDQYSRGNNIRYSEGFRNVCQKLPGILESLCGDLAEDIGDYVEQAFDMGHTVDTLCYCTGDCFISEGHHMCNFYPLPDFYPDCPEGTQNVRTKVKLT